MVRYLEFLKEDTREHFQNMTIQNVIYTLGKTQLKEYFHAPNPPSSKKRISMSQQGSRKQPSDKKAVT